MIIQEKQIKKFEANKFANDIIAFMDRKISKDYFIKTTGIRITGEFITLYFCFYCLLSRECAAC